MTERDDDQESGWHSSLLKTTVANQPTYQPPPTEYLSIRITCGEELFKRAMSEVFHDVPAIAYPHKGKNGTNPHYHVLLVSSNSEKFRKRIKDKLSLVGNKNVSVKLNKNGILSGIQYCAREGTEPITSDPDLLILVDQAPKWVQSTIKTESDGGKCKDKDWQLGYTNLVTVCVKHAREHNMIEEKFSLKEVCRHLIETTKWRPSKYMLCGGVPEFYERDFHFRLGHSKRQDMNWWTPRSI